MCFVCWVCNNWRHKDDLNDEDEKVERPQSGWFLTTWRIIPGLGSVINNHGLFSSPQDRVDLVKS